MRLETSKSESTPVREINIGRNKHNLVISNAICTCKYTIWTFVPRFLKEQFRQYNNLYFLLIVLLQQIPEVSPTGRYNTAIPFILVLLVSAVKEIYEDIKRRKSDVKANNTTTTIFRNSSWQVIKWKDVNIGDILKIRENEVFPADLLVISSSNSDNTCLVETSNLDGETNLKVKEKFNCSQGMSTSEQLDQLDCEIICEQPVKTIDEFSGCMHIDFKSYPLEIDNLLLRGTRLKDTAYIIGIVIYTGHETKVFLNSKKCPLKKPAIGSMINNRLLYLFLALIILAFCSTIGSLYFEWFKLEKAYYLYISQTNLNISSFLMTIGYRFITFLLLYNNFIPISLQCTMEIVRIGQAYYINLDSKIHNKSIDDMPVARTSNLTEELGQVEYVMCDKTGTLTQNVMELKFCSIAGKNYSIGNGIVIPQTCNSTTDTARGEYIREFFCNMAICNQVKPHVSNVNKEVTYNSSRPDEDALVKGAASVNFVLCCRSAGIVSVLEAGKERRYQVLNIFDFTSERKRMSIVVKCPDESIRVYIKGADTAILPRVVADCPFKEEMMQDFEEYVKKGFRTLFFASRKLDEQFYKQWSLMYDEACISLHNREEMLIKCAELIETELVLNGISAVEDKLQMVMLYHQSGVKETIGHFINAGIHVWMLTGDNPKTAVAIGYAANLCSKDDQKLMILNSSCDELVGEFRRIAKRIDQKRDRFMVIDGVSLRSMLCEGGREPFMFLIRHCRTVICCRMSPMDKAKVVESVRNDNSIVMAIGDGANDVAMIREANIGVGIVGKEGFEAASASDYAIGQFQFLQQLVFLHGVWNLERSTKVILYSFYKNICLYLIQFWYAFASAYSGQTLFDRWTIALFNSVFTFVPPIAIGLFDKSISAKGCIDRPEIYSSVRAIAYSSWRFYWLMFDAVVDSLLIYLFSYLVLPDSAAWKHGRTGGWLMLGNTCYTLVIVAVSLKAIFMCTSPSTAVIVSSGFSILLWLFVFYIYAQAWPVVGFGADMCGMFTMVLLSWRFLFVIIIASVMVSCKLYVFNMLQRSWISVKSFDNSLKTVHDSDFSTPLL